MNNNFSNQSYVTTDSDLKTALSNCPKCFDLTLKGTLIIPSNELPHLLLPKHKRKYFIIVHIKQPFPPYGHWISLSIMKRKQICLAIDPANQIHTYTNVSDFINQFCSKNHLKLVNFNTKFESDNSMICGQLILYACYLTSVKSLNQILHFRKYIRSKPIHSIENSLISFVNRHFNIVS